MGSRSSGARTPGPRGFLPPSKESHRGNRCWRLLGEIALRLAVGRCEASISASDSWRRSRPWRRPSERLCSMSFGASKVTAVSRSPTGFRTHGDDLDDRLLRGRLRGLPHRGRPASRSAEWIEVEERFLRVRSACSATAGVGSSRSRGRRWSARKEGRRGRRDREGRVALSGRSRGWCRV